MAILATGHGGARGRGMHRGHPHGGCDPGAVGRRRRMGAVIRFIPRAAHRRLHCGNRDRDLGGTMARLLWVARSFPGFFSSEAPRALRRLLPQWHVAKSAPIGILALLLRGADLQSTPGVRVIPGPLLALVVATAVQALGHFEGGFRESPALMAPFGHGCPGSPCRVLRFRAHRRAVCPSAFAIAMLGAIESLCPRRWRSAWPTHDMIPTRN